MPVFSSHKRRLLPGSLRRSWWAALLLILPACPALDPPGVSAPDLSNAITYHLRGQALAIEDGAGLAADSELDVNDTVQYTVIIDFDSPAYVVTNGGFRIDTPAPDGATDYYADWLGEGAVVPPAEGPFNAPGDIAEFHLAVSDPREGVRAALVLCGSNNRTLVLENKNIPLDELAVGDVVGCAEEVWNTDGEVTRVFSSLLITQIE